MFEQTRVLHNVATHTGGGVFLYHSELNCHYQSILEVHANYATNKGGGIHAISSFIKLFTHRDDYVSSLMNFTNNKAHLGGGVNLESNAGMYIQRTNIHQDFVNMNPNVRLNFVENSADNGGAIYYADETNIGVCTSLPDVNSACFFQVLSPL